MGTGHLDSFDVIVIGVSGVNIQACPNGAASRVNFMYLVFIKVLDLVIIMTIEDRTELLLQSLLNSIHKLRNNDYEDRRRQIPCLPIYYGKYF